MQRSFLTQRFCQSYGPVVFLCEWFLVTAKHVLYGAYPMCMPVMVDLDSCCP